MAARHGRGTVADQTRARARPRTPAFVGHRAARRPARSCRPRGPLVRLPVPSLLARSPPTVRGGDERDPLGFQIVS
ncbi:Hypothetical protein A7982_04749 [Minicystis rosea]|nr:Hypothetical protein A7982_04749 [Minicystis rosea]